MYLLSTSDLTNNIIDYIGDLIRVEFYSKYELVIPTYDKSELESSIKDIANDVIKSITASDKTINIELSDIEILTNSINIILKSNNKQTSYELK